MEWKDLESAPKNVPVKVWASYRPEDNNFSFREKVAVNKGYGWWEEYGKRGNRIFPTHWKPLLKPNGQQGEVK